MTLSPKYFVAFGGRILCRLRKAETAGPLVRQPHESALFTEFFLRKINPKALIMTRPSGPSESATFLETVRAVVIANLADENFGVSDLAAGLSLSRTQLFRKIKAQTGRSVVAFIQEVRVGQVKHLLGATDLPISEIAYLAGYSAPACLRRVFFRHTGQNPLAYRKAIQRSSARGTGPVRNKGRRSVSSKGFPEFQP
jgi:AraC-like DNA-binding protein